MSIDPYMRALEDRLDGCANTSPDLLEELRDHLEDSVRDLQFSGHSTEESEQEAIRRFGAPDQIAAVLTPAHRHWLRHPRAAAAGFILAAGMLGLGGGVVAAAHIPHQPIAKIAPTQDYSCRFAPEARICMNNPE